MKHYLVTEQWLNFMNKDCVAMADRDATPPIAFDLEAYQKCVIDMVTRDRTIAELEQKLKNARDLCEYKEDQIKTLNDKRDAFHKQVNERLIGLDEKIKTLENSRSGVTVENAHVVKSDWLALCKNGVVARIPCDENNGSWDESVLQLLRTDYLSDATVVYSFESRDGKPLC